MRRILVTALPLSSLLCALLAACGQTGPLRLPAGTPTPPATTVPAPLPPGAQTPPTENPAGNGKDTTTR